MPLSPLTDADIAEAENATGLRFARRELFTLALTHRSFVNEGPAPAPESNERLEFLGDGVINLAVAHRLFEVSPEASEGELTAQRAQVVRRDALARAAKKLRLGEFLVMGRGEAAGGGAARASNLANALEAVAGAVYLDCGFEGAYRFVLSALGEELATATTFGTPKDPKSTLQERLQARGGRAPEYVLAAVTGPEHDRMFEVEVIVGGSATGRGEGRRKIDAERAAALDALSRLGEPAAPRGERPVASE